MHVIETIETWGHQLLQKCPYACQVADSCSRLVVGMRPALRYASTFAPRVTKAHCINARSLNVKPSSQYDADVDVDVDADDDAGR